MVTYRTAKMSVLTYRRLHFLFTPSVIMRQYVTWLERNFDACQSRRSIYLYILNSFGVIRCLSQCVSPKIAIFTTFLFPLGTPLGAMTLNVVRMEREFNAYKLSRRMYHPSSTVSQLFEPQVQKSRFHVPQSTFLVRLEAPFTQYFPWTERQLDACQTPRSMYLSIFNSFRVKCKTLLFLPHFLFPLGTPLGQSR